MKDNIMRFDELGLAADILRAVAEQGYDRPTPIQQQAIPLVLAGQDLLAGAQTGTGKTAAFTLPVLQRLQATGSDNRLNVLRPVRALVLTPTRELAAQVHDSAETYGQYLGLRSQVVFGGVKIGPQIQRLRKGVDLLVATPGRLLDLVQQGALDLSQVEILVLDEADRMLDMGFVRDIRRVLKLLPAQRQNLLFSATFSREIKQLANDLFRDPAVIEVARHNTPAETVRQAVYPVDAKHKRALLSYLIGSNDWHQVLVFTRTKHGANRLVTQLEKDGLTAAAIHGNKSQGARTRALADFKAGRVRVLVATDIAARGLDIDQLPHVVNYELPNESESYVHRIGRTGRAGNEGEAISLVSPDERKYLRDIERLLKRRLDVRELADFTPPAVADVEPAAREPRRQRGAPGNRGGEQRQRRRRSSGEQPAGVSRQRRRQGGNGNQSQRSRRANAGNR